MVTNDEIIKMLDALIEERRKEIRVLEQLKNDPQMFLMINWTKEHRTSL